MLSVSSQTLGGSLQALIEVRDGNNMGNLQGIATGSQGSTELVLNSTNINNIDDMNLPLAGTINLYQRKQRNQGQNHHLSQHLVYVIH